MPLLPVKTWHFELFEDKFDRRTGWAGGLDRKCAMGG
jgi:hypothetical protein